MVASYCVHASVYSQLFDRALVLFFPSLSLVVQVLQFVQRRLWVPTQMAWGRQKGWRPVNGWMKRDSPYSSSYLGDMSVQG